MVFGLDGCFVRQWGTQGSGEGQFSYPFDVLVNGDEVLVTDYELTTTCKCLIWKDYLCGNGTGKVMEQGN